MGLGWVPSRAEQHPQALRPEPSPRTQVVSLVVATAAPAFILFFFLEIPDLTRATGGLQHQEDLLPEHGEVRSPAGSPRPAPLGPAVTAVPCGSAW